MDTSQQYIQMCKAAQEIQSMKKHSFENGDFYDEGEIYYIDIEELNNHEANCYGTEKGLHIWLPRQDQLQEIMKENSKGGFPFSESVYVWNQIMSIYDFAKRKHGEISYYSHEQVLLQFIMETFYNKKWNNETKQWEAI